MYQSVSISKDITKHQLETFYLTKLNKIGDVVLNKDRFDVGGIPDRLLFLKIKNLLPVVCDPFTDVTNNELYTALIN